MFPLFIKKWSNSFSRSLSRIQRSFITPTIKHSVGDCVHPLMRTLTLSGKFTSVFLAIYISYPRTMSQCLIIPAHVLTSDDMKLLSKTSFNLNDLYNLKDKFNRIDVLCYGKITGIEFALFFDQKFELDHAHMGTLFHIFDQHHSGSIDFEEFVLISDKLVNGSNVNKLGFFFFTADVDGNGKLSMDEVKNVLILLFRLSDKTAKVHQILNDMFYENFEDENEQKNGEKEKNIKTYLTKEDLIAWELKDSPCAKLVLEMISDFGKKFMKC